MNIVPPTFDPAALREEALALAARGYRVVPVCGLACASPLCPACRRGEKAGKRPLVSNWVQLATTRGWKIRWWWEEWEHANVGIVAGPDSGPGGCVVIDFDPRNGSGASIKRLERNGFSFPPTLTVATGGGGEHLYYVFPAGRRLGSTPPALVGVEGIDVKTRGGLVLAPPSLHASGGQYSWVTDPDTPLAPLPEWLLEGLPWDLEHLRPTGCDRYAWTVVVSEIDKVRRKRQGDRNNGLFRAATRVGQVLPEDFLYEARDHLLDAGLAIGLGRGEAEGVIARGFEHGAHNPREPKAGFRNREDALLALEEINSAMLRVPWPGHRGQRTRTTLKALIRLAQRAGGPVDFAAGLDRVSVEAGIARSTAHRALQELMDDGWVTRLMRGFTRGDDRVPSRWKLHLPASVQKLRTRTVGTPHRNYLSSTSQLSLAPGHDVWRGATPERAICFEVGDSYFEVVPYGLGKTPYAVMETLTTCGEPLRQVDIAKRLGVAPSTVKRALEKLVAHGWVVKEGRWHYTPRPLTQEDLERVADDLKVDGAARLRRKALSWDLPDVLPEERPLAIGPEE